jgi:hypothetical protein
MIEQIHNVSTTLREPGSGRSVVMNDTMSDLISEATLLSEVSDEVLEAAASIEGPARAFSFSFSSYHLSCC